MSHICSVCINDKCKIVNCICEFKACINCHKRYLLNTFSESKCMACNILWTRQFLISQFPKSFIDGSLKKHRQKILISKELQLIPHSMETVERLKEIKQLRQQILNNKNDYPNKKTLFTKRLT